MPQLIPLHYYSKNFSPAYEQKFIDILNGYKFEETILPFSEIDLKIESLRQHIVRYFINTIDLDVSNRILSKDKVYFQDPKLFEETIIKLKENPENMRGYYSDGTHRIFILTTDRDGNLRSEGSLLKSLCHELIHSLSYKYYDVLITEGKIDFYSILQGFGTFDTLEWDYMLEGYTEIVISEIFRNFINLDPTLKNDFIKAYNIELTGYWDNVIILRAIIDKGKSLKVNGQELIDNLSRDFILGEANGLHIIEDIIGSNCYDLYKNITSKNRNITEIIELAESLNLNEFVLRVRNIPHFENMNRSELFKILGVRPKFTV